MTAPATTRRRTRKASTRPARRRPLPRLGWWWLALPILIGAAIKTWPAQALAALTIAALYVILRAIRPARLAAAIDRIDRHASTIATRRRTLPRPTHGPRPLHLFQQMNPAQFEQAIAELAAEDDTVHTATRVGQPNDRGADVLLNLKDGRRILIQCKRYRNGNNVRSEDVQKTNGTYRDIHHCHAAIIITTSGFTRDAYNTNAMLQQPIRLIDGPQLDAWANGAPPPWT